MPRVALQHVECLEAATGTTTALVAGVGHALQLVEDEPRDEEVVAKETRPAQRQQLGVQHRGRVDEEAVGVVVRTRPHERSRRQTQHLEHLDALAPEDAKAEPAHDPREETRDGDRGPGRE